MSKKDIIIFTDGAKPNNQNNKSNIGGIGIYIYYNDGTTKNISEKITTNKVTNQVCELLACITGLESIINNNNNIIIYTDSMYVINSITEWSSKWSKNNWKKANNKEIENKELIMKLYYLSLKYDVEYRHVKAHQCKPSESSNDYFEWYGNNIADTLATGALFTI